MIAEAGERRSRASGSEKLQARTVVQRFVWRNLRRAARDSNPEPAD